jgi:hypothetical protein
MGTTWPRLVNDFFHDLAAGFFPGAVAGAWLIRSVAPAGGVTFFAQQAIGGVWMVLVLGLSVSVGTGIFRLRYHLTAVRPERVKARNDAAFTKHVGFIVVLLLAGVVFGVWVA